MPGFFKAAAIVMSGGAIVGAGALATLPDELLQSPPVLATGQLTGLPSVPCEQQLWLNADRACQTWTVPHRDVQRVLSPEPVLEGPSRESPAAPTTSTRLTDESAGKAHGHPLRAGDVRAGSARIARGENVARRLRVMPRTANATLPGFTFWPSQQDAFRQRPPSRSTDMTRAFAFFGSPAR